MSWLFEPFAPAFMQAALLAVLLLSLNCAGVGTYVVLRRMSFIGSALTHTILPGIVAGYLFGWGTLPGATVGAVVTALLIGWLTRRRTVREDTAIGVLYSGLFALGILLMTLRGVQLDIHGLLFGPVLGVEPGALGFIAVTTVLVNGVLWLVHKELELSSCDETYSRVIGQRPDLLRYLLLVLTSLTVVSGIQAVGLLLTSAFLVTPAAAAVLLSRRLSVVMLLAFAIAAASGTGGLWLSAVTDWSAGACIVLLATAAFFAAWLAHELRRRRQLG